MARATNFIVLSHVLLFLVCYFCSISISSAFLLATFGYLLRSFSSRMLSDNVVLLFMLLMTIIMIKDVLVTLRTNKADCVLKIFIHQ